MTGASGRFCLIQKLLPVFLGPHRNTEWVDRSGTWIARKIILPMRTFYPNNRATQGSMSKHYKCERRCHCKEPLRQAQDQLRRRASEIEERTMEVIPGYAGNGTQKAIAEKGAAGAIQLVQMRQVCHASHF